MKSYSNKGGSHEPFDAHDGSKPKRLPAESYEEFLAREISAQKFHIPNLLPDRKTTVIKYDRNICRPAITTSAMLFSYGLAGGKQFPPFPHPGPDASVPVYFCAFTTDEDADQKLLKQITEFDSKEVSRDRVRENLIICHQKQSGTTPPDLGSAEGQDLLRKSIPSDTEVVVIDDLSACLPHREKKGPYRRSVTEFFAGLNEDGIAALVFVPSDLKIDLPESDIWLTKETDAPQEYGGGYTVNRSKIRNDDPVPTTFIWWYTILDGLFDFGWNLPSEKDGKTAKQIEVTERVMRAAELVAKGMTQTEVAAKLGVGQHTISRDLAKAKAEAAKPERDDDAEVEAAPIPTPKPAPKPNATPQSEPTPQDNDNWY